MSENKPQVQREEEVRIGVFICHCGLNIAGVIDIAELVEFSKTLPSVVYVKENRYTCADPGQEEIRKGIKEHRLNRVVVAACSPRLHEPTFRRCVAEAGLNPYLFEMANIREFSSWCHPSTPKEATDKAKDLIKIAVAKVQLLRPLETIEVPVINKALVIGGGITGLSAALDLAEMGFKVYLIERNEYLGGHATKLNKTFPIFECSVCPFQQHCMQYSCVATRTVLATTHPNIEVYTCSEVKEIEGVIGTYKVKVVKNPRYVDEDRCVGCGLCSEECPVEVPNDFDEGFRSRKAIYKPFQYAIPITYKIDKENCLRFKDQTCNICQQICPTEAINFEQQPQELIFDVGTIIVATGFKIYEPRDLENFGYGKYRNVVTSMELERIVSTNSPVIGRLFRPSDGKEPKSIAFIHCVGVRDPDKYPYCSGFCCIVALKQAVMLKEKYGDKLDVYTFYTDMRTNRKSYEELYNEAQEMGIKFTRVKLTNRRIEEDGVTGNLILHAEDENGNLVKVDVEMVVLSVPATPQDGAEEIARVLNIPRGADGFFMESHPKLKPIDTPADGVFIAGGCQGPKDISYSVSQGSGAAARAATILSKSTWEIEPIVAVVDPDRCRNVKTKCGICAQRCPYGAIRAEEGKPAQVMTAMCHGCGTCVAECPTDAITQMHFADAQIFAQIRAALETDPEDKILAFLCNWCAYAGADLAGTSRFEYPPTIRPIRVMCSGRVDRDFILEAFRLGAGMVLVGACHLPYDCHYISGNLRMKARMDALAPMLQKLGLSPERFHVEYVSAAEGVKFAEVVREMTEKMHALGKNRIKTENEKLRPVLENMLRKKKII